MPEAGEDLGDDAVAGRGRVVAGRAWAGEGDVGGIVGGGEEAADAVAEMDDGGVGEADGLFQAGGIAGGFVEGWAARAMFA